MLPVAFHTHIYRGKNSCKPTVILWLIVVSFFFPLVDLLFAMALLAAKFLLNFQK